MTQEKEDQSDPPSLILQLLSSRILLFYDYFEGFAIHMPYIDTGCG